MTKDINITIVDNIQYNYHSFFENRNTTTYSYFRFDIFANPIFQDFDNLMYIDVDTEFNKPIDELFTTTHEPGIYMVKEWGKRWVLDKTIDKYCNAGMIFTTPSQLDEKTKFDLFLELVSCSSKNQLKYADQDALNYVLS